MPYEGLGEQYVRLLDTAPKLSRNEQADLARAYRSGDDSAGDRLVRSMLRYVVHVAKGFRYGILPLEDLVSHGCVGLLQALETYDPDAGALTTHAKWPIISSIQYGLAEMAPVHGSPTSHVMTEDKRRAVLSRRGKPLVRKNGETGRNEEYLEAPEAPPQELPCIQELAERFDEFRLTGRQREVLSLHYVDQLNFGEIGRRLDIHRNNASSACKAAIRNLRKQDAFAEYLPRRNAA